MCINKKVKKGQISMTIENMRKTERLYDYLPDHISSIEYGGVPDVCGGLIDNAAILKRNKEYDESLSLYFDVISRGYLTTEILRMMAKTYCAMNEYLAAFVLLLTCERVVHGYAPDFYILKDAIVCAKNGDTIPLFERTKEVSGQRNYQNEKSNSEIISECKLICEQARL